MQSDSFFTMGKAHTVCEDYARDGKIPGTDRVFAIVSDGCSSSPDTDFGSRFLTMSAIHALEHWDEYKDSSKALHAIIRQARESVRAPLSVDCLDATLLMAFEREDGLIEVIATGDGIVLARTRSGEIHSWEITMGGAPGYLSYVLDLKRFQSFLDQGYGKRIVTYRIDGAEISRQETEMTCHPEDPSPFYNVSHPFLFSPEFYDVIVVLSDGVESFRNHDTLEQVPLVDVLPHVADIRVSTGAFLRRAHHWFLNKTCPKLSWQHTDDFGSAAIFMDPPPGPEEVQS